MKATQALNGLNIENGWDPFFTWLFVRNSIPWEKAAFNEQDKPVEFSYTQIARKM